jgi:subtilisin family serine protease
MRLLPAIALSASLALGACTHYDGSPDYAGTAALGLGAAAVVGLAAVAASNNNNHNNNHYYQDRRYDRRHSGYRGDRYAYRGDRGYRRW